MKYLVHRPEDGEQNTTIRVEDGGVVTLHHNGEHMLTTYYQDRCTNVPEPDWEELAEGKAYIKDWEGQDLLTQDMIQDALDWLVMGTHEWQWKEVQTEEELFVK